MDDPELSTVNAKYLTAIGDPYFASPTRPLHVRINSWDEETHKIEDYIADNIPFEGKWQSYVHDLRLVIPEQLRHLFNNGGVIAVSTERHLNVYGLKHWQRLQRLLAKQVGLSPVHTKVARHIYSQMHRFSALNVDNTIDVPAQLLAYANIEREVAIIGMIYSAEVHGLADYMNGQKQESQDKLLEDFKSLHLQ